MQQIVNNKIFLVYQQSFYCCILNTCIMYYLLLCIEPSSKVKTKHSTIVASHQELCAILKSAIANQKRNEDNSVFWTHLGIPHLLVPKHESLRCRVLNSDPHLPASTAEIHERWWLHTAFPQRNCRKEAAGLTEGFNMLL